MARLKAPPPPAKVMNLAKAPFSFAPELTRIWWYVGKGTERAVHLRAPKTQAACGAPTVGTRALLARDLKLTCDKCKALEAQRGKSK